MLWFCYCWILFVFLACVQGDVSPASSSSPSSSTLLQCAKEGLAAEQIHLSITGDHDITVMWITQKITLWSHVKYFKGHCNMASPAWKVATGEAKTYSPYDGFIHTVVLEDLEEDEKYCYSVGGGSGGTNGECSWGALYSFSTPNKDAGEFAAYADQGTWADVTPIQDSLATDPDVGMVVHAGDLSYGTTEAVWDTFGKMTEKIAASKPYMILPGNWDVKPDAVKAFVNRYTMPLVKPPDLPTALNYYYSFNYSVFHIVMLSSYDPYTNATAQYNWLISDLVHANRDRKKHPWLVVCFHSPMYSSNTGHGGGDEKFRAAIEDLLVKYHVDLVLTGHDHGYERSYPVYNNSILSTELSHYDSPKAPVHILVGTAGATLDAWMDRPSWSAHRESSTGYTKVIADHSSLHVIYLRHNLTVGDEFWISRRHSISLTYVFGIIAVIFFCVLPFCLYKGLPSTILSYLMCSHDDFASMYNKFI